MAYITDPNEQEALRESGRRLGGVLSLCAQMARPGVSIAEINERAHTHITEQGDTPAFLHYTPAGAPRPFPAAVCISVNDEIVHGIPNESPHTLNEGDIVSIDAGVVHKGMVTDAAVTVPVGEIPEATKQLLSVTKEALAKGVAAAVPGGRTGDIGAAIEQYVRPYGFGIFRELGGHGVGRSVHEPPYIGNIGSKGTGTEIVPGMAIAIEPMLSAGSREIAVDADGYTIRTADGSQSAHFEHTILVTENGPEVLTGNDA